MSERTPTTEEVRAAFALLVELDDRFAESDHKAAKWYRKWREATR